MNELEKIKYTKTFIDKMAQGINPLDDTPICSSDLLNNVRISRCLFYVSDILRDVIKKETKSKKVSKKPFFVELEKLGSYDFETEPTFLGNIASKLNSLVDTDIYEKISYKDIANWLVKNDFLMERQDNLGHSRKYVTEKGLEIGIFCETRAHYGKEYNVNLYNLNAQQYIIDNLSEIINLKYNN